MSDLLLSYGITSYISQNILIVPFQTDFYVEVLDVLQQEILLQLHNNHDIQGLVIDLSKVILIDLSNIKALQQSLEMASLLGVVGFLVGIQPSVTLALLELGYEPSKLHTAPNIEYAIKAINQNLSKHKTHCEEIGLEVAATPENMNDLENDHGG